jgi:isoquinoline 1-oxidoreductase beta subunit
VTLIKTSYGRRSFLKTSALAGGGLVVGFSWLASCNPSTKEVAEMPKEWFEINGYLKIGDNGLATIMSPNPEIGQNVKTSMPMIVAEELDIDWDNVIVEQAPLNTAIFSRQIAGGSQAIRQGWDGLRMAGATAREMLKQAAAQQWEVPISELTTDKGVISHKASNRTLGYGEVASLAATLTAPKEVELKSYDNFKIIGTPTKNVDGLKIVTGKPLFGIDQQQDGMLIAMIVAPPAFGLKLKSFDDTKARTMPGIKDIFTINTYQGVESKSMFDVDAFPEVLVVVGNSTWEVMQAKKQISAQWEPFEEYEEHFTDFSGENTISQKVPAGKENTEEHYKIMEAMSLKASKVVRKDGDPELAFKDAAKVIERSYTAPFLSHSTMEPMNFFADVKADKAVLSGPVQTPEYMEKSAAQRLGLPLDKVELNMTRQGGGFGRRLYGHFVVEAGVISQKMQTPIKLVYTREDDMTFGTYRPTYHARYRAALDKDNNLIGFHVRAGGIPESPLFANRFPAGAVDNYLAESWDVPSNITVGAFRAPRSNFIAGVEQAFLDEIAEQAGKDPIEFRLELFEKAKNNPVGENNDYDPERYAGVLKLARDKSGWNTNNDTKLYRGVSAYYCHNSYVANILDMVIENDKPLIKKVYAAVDCGIVVNPIAATNMVEGGTVDGIGNAMYGGLTFTDGAPLQNNFDRYRLIRHQESPKEVEVHFVENSEHPTGLGEPPFPPVMGALANALYKATGQRHYDQPFITNKKLVG